MESLVPDEIANKKYDWFSSDWDAMQDELLEDIKVVDDAVAERVRAAEAEGARLCHEFKIDKESGKCQVKLQAVGNTDRTRTWCCSDQSSHHEGGGGGAGSGGDGYVHVFVASHSYILRAPDMGPATAHI